jgi:hypothetical protein
MRNIVEFRSAKTFLLLFCLIGILLCAGLLLRRYRPYISASIWHRLHGNYAQIGGHRVRVPKLWWRADDAAYNTPLLLRALPSTNFARPQIVVNSAITGEVRGSDQEELESTERSITLQKKAQSSGTSVSLVVINAKAFTLYCHKEEAAPMGIKLYSHLTCHAAAVPYTWIYQGPPMFEGEAESILSTVE